MPAEAYTVVLTGFSPDAGSREELATRLSTVFGIGHDRASWTLEQLPFEVATDADRVAAERYLGALRALGGSVELRSQSEPTRPLDGETEAIQPLAADPTSHTPPSHEGSWPSSNKPLELLGYHEADDHAPYNAATTSTIPAPDEHRCGNGSAGSERPVVAGVAAHALGREVHNARAPAIVKRGEGTPLRTDQRAPGELKVRTRRDRPRLGRGSILLLIALAWAGYYYLQQPSTISVETANGRFSLEYIERLSETAKPDGQPPLVIALHGNGDTPAEFYEPAFKGFDEPARFILFRAPNEFDGGRFGGRAWPGGEALPRYAERLQAAIDQLAARHSPGCKPILLGFSGGAALAYYFALQHPQAYSLIIPVAGHMHAAYLEGAESNIADAAPVRIFHGRSDRVVSARASQVATAELVGVGRDVELEMVAGGHQAIFRAARAGIMELMRQTISACGE